MDYLGDGDFDTVSSIAMERPGIGIVCSSTPTGKRGKFWELCTNPKMNYVEHYHPSTHNPSWNNEMEAEFRAQLSEQGYIHEVLAEFGTQERGVFNKDKVDLACTFEWYAYDKLTHIQEMRCKELNFRPEMYIFNERAYPNPFRCMGVKSNLPPCIVIYS